MAKNEEKKAKKAKDAAKEKSPKDKASKDGSTHGKCDPVRAPEASAGSPARALRAEHPQLRGGVPRRPRERPAAN